MYARQGAHELLAVLDHVGQYAENRIGMSLTEAWSTRISRALDGRQVDVVLLAPNLRRLPIHDIALRERKPL